MLEKPYFSIIELHPEVVKFNREYGNVGYIANIEYFIINGITYIPTSEKGIYVVIDNNKI